MWGCGYTLGLKTGHCDLGDATEAGVRRMVTKPAYMAEETMMASAIMTTVDIGSEIILACTMLEAAVHQRTADRGVFLDTECKKIKKAKRAKGRGND